MLLFNPESNESWKLVWQDNFQSEDYFEQNWVVNYGNCNEWDTQISCNVKENVKLEDGFLVMSNKEEKYGQMNYTGARLTTDRAFGYGRYEVRAALSVDKHISSYFNTHIDTFVTDGYFIMHEFDDIPKSWHIANFPENFKIYNRNFFQTNYGTFHLYGMEWSQNEVRFFIDDHYSETVWLDNATRWVKPEQHIRLWLGVLHNHKLFPDQVKWKCPLYILDYVRVYEKVPNPNVGLKVELCDKQNDVDQSSEKQRELVDSFCARKTSQMIESFLGYLTTF